MCVERKVPPILCVFKYAIASRNPKPTDSSGALEQLRAAPHNVPVFSYEMSKEHGDRTEI